MCIIQGDDGDWKHEAASMASIYRNATFTISAARSRGSYDSLFSDPTNTAAGEHIGDLPRVGPVRLEKEPAHPFSYLEDEAYLMGSGLVLLGRGWVYQEVLLSPRTLYFLPDEIMWRCQEHVVCQCARYDADDMTGYSKYVKVHTGKSGIHQISDGARKRLFRRDWAQLVFDYASREFTFHKDKLPALAGVAEEFGKQRQWTYICGLWQEDLPRNLMWHRRPQSDPETRPKGPDKLPTWTWASISSPLVFAEGEPKSIQFESCNLEYNDEETGPYLGDVRNAVLTITGDFFPAKLIEKRNSYRLKNLLSPYPDRNRYGVSIMSEYFMGLIEDCFHFESTRKLKNSDVLCLATENEYKDFEGLVLHCVDIDNELYERIGWVSYDRKPDWRSWNVVRRQVKLV